jgi:hypothetical protein
MATPFFSGSAMAEGNEQGGRRAKECGIECGKGVIFLWEIKKGHAPAP